MLVFVDSFDIFIESSPGGLQIELCHICQVPMSAPQMCLCLQVVVINRGVLDPTRGSDQLTGSARS